MKTLLLFITLSIFTVGNVIKPEPKIEYYAVHARDNVEASDLCNNFYFPRGWKLDTVYTTYNPQSSEVEYLLIFEKS